ncbi:hypoxanthine-guanine phosphoribosyltransferase [Halothiobacillus diazotrophicus]|uniref:Hypoxanthine-guanine phosphoribosyltransferase n=1 Tax=Halothiobacillus diazotrophicus TaxID=1860122 RepID=A0A191ZFK0_9GAMM|nr:hypoxanthine-guanine phosphoribosyltransferase [Halothiobacillus diazotrophicus]ANJ66643.1 hypoxanthine-guanine phosphoribosyltransferase [Halothiobacillus diazotrophicus]
MSNELEADRRTIERVTELNALLASCDVLVTEAEMQAIYDRMAQEITQSLSERLPIVLAVMNGGLIVSGQLLSRLRFPLEVSYLHATRYRGSTSGGALKWLAQPDMLLTGRDVLILDDILDEGHTLKAVRDWCEAAGARKVWIAVATDKLHDRKVPNMKADFVGLSVPDRYIFGEGMDYHGFFRNVAGIYALPESH